MPIPPVAYRDDVEHFKYGSLGSEHEFGIPYWIWRALPELFNDKLPGKKNGWQSVGFVFEKGKTLPVGMSQRRYLGFDVVWLNCAFCHAGTVRETPQSEPKVYAAMPANTFDFRGFTRFLFATGEDRRFTPQDMLRQIDIIRKREGLGTIAAGRSPGAAFLRHLLHARACVNVAGSPGFHQATAGVGTGPGRYVQSAENLFNFPPDKAFARKKSSAPPISRRFGIKASAKILKMNLTLGRQ